MLKISVNSVRDGKLPNTATGVRWVDTDVTVCRTHLSERWASTAPPSDRRTGIILTGTVNCDYCPR